MDLRKFIGQLRDSGELAVVEGANWDLEIGAITELSDERNGPALLFDLIKDYLPGYRILTNYMAAPRRLSMAFGFDPETPNIEVVRLIKEKFKQLKPVLPEMVTTGTVLENMFGPGQIDLSPFPAPKWHEYDGGKYLGTGDIVIMRDMNDGWVNAGTYRIQLQDRDTLSLYIAPGRHGRIIREQYWAAGKPCPVAVVFGAHPLVWIPSMLGLPWKTEEFRIAGAFLGQPLRLVTGEYTKLPIPADAEIAVEGDYLPPKIESRTEGPFGEWPGYYGSGAREEGVIKVKRVMHRNDPVVTGSPPLKPPSGGNGGPMMRAANVWHELELLGIPGIKGVWNIRSGGSRFLTAISITQKYAGHAKQVAMAAMSGVEGGFYGRFVIVVDDDIDPSNNEDVLWAVATRCDPATAIEIINGCWSAPSDPIVHPSRKAQGDMTNSRAIINACRPYHWRNEFPRVNRASDELRASTLAKWPQLFGR